MINKKTSFSATFLQRLLYMMRGDGHSHKLTKEVNGKEEVMVSYLGGNILSPSPFIKNESGELSVNVEQINEEMEKQAALHKGTGEMFCAHYVLSLAENEEMTKGNWLSAATMYMQKMGFGKDTKWVAAIHDETGNQHVHIVACRVKNNGKLVNDKNDYKKGYEAVREIESKFGLVKVASPDESFGTEYSIQDTKFGRGKGTEAAEKDPVFIIRAIFKSIMKDSKPDTITDLVNQLSGRGVAVKVVTDNQNRPTGIKYSLDNKKWISG